MKKLFAILVALGLMISTSSVAAISAESDNDGDEYLGWTELLPLP
jgi:hypothetical protein